ncbi:hypothetical protein [Tuwongella immobilis]|uniref:Uncharacterized protein n=1 Tax=Tuwongella immobilis TaxID=692036 RepID=A0A6C2YI97_9BACT|nr:hypothetical protein [Tuwongella immobilis]VIP01136.1 unnamed protein product [Tuwongella immobilis]VTR97697.1 unnamed protein product [Tuwongella immobilis]
MMFLVMLGFFVYWQVLTYLLVSQPRPGGPVSFRERFPWIFAIWKVLKIMFACLICLYLMIPLFLTLPTQVWAIGIWLGVLVPLVIATRTRPQIRRHIWPISLGVSGLVIVCLGIAAAWDTRAAYQWATSSEMRFAMPNPRLPDRPPILAANHRPKIDSDPMRYCSYSDCGLRGSLQNLVASPLSFWGDHPFFAAIMCPQFSGAELREHFQRLSEDPGIPQPLDRMPEFVGGNWSLDRKLPSPEWKWQWIHEKVLEEFFRNAACAVPLPDEPAVTVGFLGHGIESRNSQIEPNCRRIERLKIPLQGTPRIRMQSTYPTLRQSNGAMTRELDSFERWAFAQLQEGETLLVREVGNGVRMLGAISCAKSCQRCHAQPEGDLLGAFSYWIMDR